MISHVWPYCLPMGLLAVGYLAVGDYMRKRNLLQKKISWEAWTAILAVFLITSAFGRVNIVACEWRLGLLDVAGSFCAGFLILRIYAAFMRREPHGKLTGFLEEVGFHSIWIVCFHAYEKIIFPWYRVAGLFSGYPWLGVGICFLGRCAVMYLIYKLVFWAAGKLKRKKLRGAGL